MSASVLKEMKYPKREKRGTYNRNIKRGEKIPNHKSILDKKGAKDWNWRNEAKNAIWKGRSHGPFDCWKGRTHNPIDCTGRWIQEEEEEVYILLKYSNKL